MPTPTPFFCNTRFSKTEAISLIQSMVAEFNSLVRFQNSKKFADFGRTNFQEYRVQDSAIFDRLFDLSDSVAYFAKTIGVYVNVQRRRLKLVIPE